MKTITSRAITVVVLWMLLSVLFPQVFAGTTDIELQDADRILNILTHQPYSTSDIDLSDDINDDNQLGLPETIYCLQSIISVWYKDADNDGYSDGTSIIARDKPEGYCSVASLISMETDCNDNSNTIYPGAPEICSDGIDQDCNGYDCKLIERFSGKYSGTFIGDSWGDWEITVDTTGKIFGKAQEGSSGEWTVIIGNVSLDGNMGFTSGFTSSGAEFQGTINDSTGQIQGTWVDNYYNESGTFAGTGEFIEPSGNFDQYKGIYYGTYSGSGEYGYFYAGIDAFGNLHILLEDGELSSTTIDSNGNFSMVAYTEDGRVTGSGQVYSNGRISGTWQLSIYSGTFYATRQQL